MIFPAITLLVVFRYTESDIGVLVKPDCQWVPTGDKDPLSDVKLPVINDHAVFNALLNNPKLRITSKLFNPIYKSLISLVYFDSTTTRR